MNLVMYMYLNAWTKICIYVSCMYVGMFIYLFVGIYVRFMHVYK